MIELHRKKQTAEHGKEDQLRRLAVCLVLGYLVLTVLFYFLVGNSKGVTGISALKRLHAGLGERISLGGELLFGLYRAS